MSDNKVPFICELNFYVVGISHFSLVCARAGSATLRQVQFAAMDLELHARYQPAPGRTVFDGALDAVIARTSVMPRLPEDRCAASRAGKAQSVSHDRRESLPPAALYLH